MSDLQRPRRTLESISELFISVAPRLARPHMGAPGPFARPKPEAARGEGLRARLWVYETEAPALALGASFAQWLLSFVPRATLLAPPPAPGEWAPLAERFDVSPWLEDFSVEPIQPCRAHENLTIIFAEPSARPEAGPGPTPVAAPRAAGPEAVNLSGPPAWNRALVELAVGPAGMNGGAEGLDLLALVLPARIEAFARAYRTLREEICGPPPVLALIVDDPRPGACLAPVGEAWRSVAALLGARGQLLGGISSRRLANPALPIAQRLRLCEEQLSLRLRDWPAAPPDDSPARRAAEEWAAYWERIGAENSAAPEAVAARGPARVQEAGIHG